MALSWFVRFIREGRVRVVMLLAQELAVGRVGGRVERCMEHSVIFA